MQKIGPGDFTRRVGLIGGEEEGFEDFMGTFVEVGGGLGVRGEEGGGGAEGRERVVGVPLVLSLCLGDRKTGLEEGTLMPNLSWKVES